MFHIYVSYIFAYTKHTFPRLCSKVKFHIKHLFGAKLHLKGTHDLYLFRTYKCIWHNAVLLCFTTISIVVYFSTAACSRAAEAMFLALVCIVTHATFLHQQRTFCMQLFGTRYPCTRSTFANRMLSAEEPWFGLRVKLMISFCNISFL